MIERVREYRESNHLYIGFFDLKAAFSSLDHTAIWHILRSTEMTRRIITLFSRLYDSAESNVVSSGRQSMWFPVMIEFRYSCVATSDLFNCTIDFLMSHVCKKVQDVQLGNYHLTFLLYTDNSIQFAESPANLESTLCIYNDKASKLGLRVKLGQK